MWEIIIIGLLFCCFIAWLVFSGNNLKNTSATELKGNANTSGQQESAPIPKATNKIPPIPTLEQNIQNRKEQPIQNKATRSKVFFAWGRMYDFDVVGESNYQNNLSTLCGSKNEKSKFMEEVACLQREPNNRHDPNAVVVRIKGMVVAYLSRSDAKTFTNALKNNGIEEDSFIFIRAAIVGGWKRGNSVGNFGVKLDMPEYSKLKYCISDISFEDADEKLKGIPLTSQQKQQLKILDLKHSNDVTFFSFDNYLDKYIKEIKKSDPALYSKWASYSEEINLRNEIYEFWSDRDELEAFDIKKPSKTELNKAIKELLETGKSLDEIIDDPDLLFELLVENNPDLEK